MGWWAILKNQGGLCEKLQGKLLADEYFWKSGSIPLKISEKLVKILCIVTASYKKKKKIQTGS